MFSRCLLLFMLLAMTGCGDQGYAGQKPFAQLRVLAGTARVTHQGQTTTLKEGTAAVAPGDTVETDPAANAVVTVGPHLHVMAEKTRLTIESAGNGDRARLLEGVASFLLPHNPTKKLQFEAVTNSVVAAVKGTIFRMESSGGVERVSVLRGTVGLSATGSLSGLPAQLTAGSAVTVSGGHVTTETLSSDQVNALRAELMVVQMSMGVDLTTF